MQMIRDHTKHPSDNLTCFTAKPQAIQHNGSTTTVQHSGGFQWLKF
jgi:hypothetical protein